MGMDARLQVEGLEHRRWINRLFGGPIIVRLKRDQAEARLMIRFQRVRDCVLPDDRDRLVQTNPNMSYAVLDEATSRLWNLWKAAGRPSIFEVV